MRTISNNTIAYVVGEIAAEKMIKEYNLDAASSKSPSLSSKI